MKFYLIYYQFSHKQRLPPPHHPNLLCLSPPILAVVCQTQPSSASPAVQIVYERSCCEPHCKPPNASVKLTQSTTAPSPITTRSAAGADKIEEKLKHFSIEKNSVSNQMELKASKSKLLFRLVCFRCIFGK